MDGEGFSDRFAKMDSFKQLISRDNLKLLCARHGIAVRTHDATQQLQRIVHEFVDHFIEESAKIAYKTVSGAKRLRERDVLAVEKTIRKKPHMNREQKRHKERLMRYLKKTHDALVAFEKSLE